MIVVKIELHSARTGQVSQLGEMHISNDGITTREQDSHGSYNVELKRAPHFIPNTKTVTVENWPRHSRTVWQLVQRALNNLYNKDVRSDERWKRKRP